MGGKGSKFHDLFLVTRSSSVTALPLDSLYLPELERSGQVKGKRSSNNF